MKIVRIGDFDIGGGFFMNDYIMGLELPGDASDTRGMSFEM
jgi:hypothetical protein